MYCCFHGCYWFYPFHPKILTRVAKKFREDVFLIANYTDVTDREQEQKPRNAGDTPATTGTNEDSEDSKQKITKETKILFAETGEPSLPSPAGESLRSFLLLETKQETASQSSALQFLS